MNYSKPKMKQFVQNFVVYGKYENGVLSNLTNNFPLTFRPTQLKINEFQVVSNTANYILCQIYVDFCSDPILLLSLPNDSNVFHSFLNKKILLPHWSGNSFSFLPPKVIDTSSGFSANDAFSFTANFEFSA